MLVQSSNKLQLAVGGSRGEGQWLVDGRETTKGVEGCSVGDEDSSRAA